MRVCHKFPSNIFNELCQHEKKNSRHNVNKVHTKIDVEWKIVTIFWLFYLFFIFFIKTCKYISNGSLKYEFSLIFIFIWFVIVWYPALRKSMRLSFNWMSKYRDDNSSFYFCNNRYKSQIFYDEKRIKQKKKKKKKLKERVTKKHSIYKCLKSGRIKVQCEYVV